MLGGKGSGREAQENGHGLRVHPRQNEAAKPAIQRAGGGHRIDVLAHDLARGMGALRKRRPAAALAFMEAPKAGLILAEQHQGPARFHRQLGGEGLPSGAEVFLYAAKASGVVRG
jgi:hypothetical protein